MSRVAPRPVARKQAVLTAAEETRYMRTFRDASHCRGCGSPNDGTVVGCHLNSVGMGHGTGIKTRGAVFPGCGKCHEIIDRRGEYSRPEYDGLRRHIVYRVAQCALIRIAELELGKC